ncbi:hypothetical protein KI387_020982 [Taxus chinensis]|uniref:Hexosyltransferase n=1 Tax=Taxus chinensis TaxID=29808 RepID=A0AA38GC90_TAXCH|nr:hypothetical protein KI387_020982 [Taxus chinensis]
MDCFCEKTWSHTPQYKIGYCQQCPDKVRWPAEMEKQRPALYFNAGMLVFEPSKLTFHNMMETLMSTPPTPFAEQGSKPWRFTGKEENMEREDIKKLVSKWWEIYNDESLDLRSSERRADAENRSELQQITTNAISKPTHVSPAPPAA